MSHGMKRSSVRFRKTRHPTQSQRWVSSSSGSASGRVGNDPLSIRLEKLQANCKAFFRDKLAVGHSRQRAKRSGWRSDRKPIVLLPAANSQDARASRTDVLGKSCFGTRLRRVATNLH